MTSRLLAIIFLVIILIGGILFFKKNSLPLFKNTQRSASSSASFTPSTSWKENIKQIIDSRADITITAGNMYIEMTPVNQDDWHLVIKPITSTTSSTMTIDSKKMNLHLTQPIGSNSATLPEDLSLDTTVSTFHLRTLLSTLPDNK